MPKFAFTPDASVSHKTRQKVEEAARELGYSPSFIARSLTTKRTKLIGLVANNFQNPAAILLKSAERDKYSKASAWIGSKRAR